MPGGNPIQWVLQNQDKMPNPQDIFKSMLQAGMDKGATQDQLKPIQSIMDGFGFGSMGSQ